MSSSGHKHRKHRHSRSGGFFSRLLGREQPERTHHRSEFPGITLPKEGDANDWRKKAGEEPQSLPGEESGPAPRVESKPAQEEESRTVNGSTATENAPVRGFSSDLPDRLEEFRHEAARYKPAKNRSIFSAIRIYFKKSALRREERVKQRLKRKIKREHLKEYRQKEKGRSLAQKLFTVTEWGESASKEAKISLFSRHSSLYRNMTITINSTFVFLVSYVLAYLFYWLTCMLVASWYGLDSTLYYYDLKFNDHSNLWSRFNILLITGIPPFFSLFLGLFLFRVIFKMKRFAGLQKLLILWTSFHLFNHFFGAFPSGVVTDEGFGYVAAWMYMNTAFKFMFSIVSLFVLGLIGYFSAEQILETSDSVNRIKAENRTAFLLTQMVIPWLVGTIALLLIRMPKNFDYPYETLMLFSMVFLIIPPFFNEKVKPMLNLLKVKKRRSINFGYFAMMLVLIAFLRIMLGIGLHFVIKIDISISPAGI